MHKVDDKTEKKQVKLGNGLLDAITWLKPA